MALQKCGLNLSRNRRELQPHGTPDFQCAAFSSVHTNSIEDEIPWHWHEEIEVIYLAKGKLKLRVPGKTICVQEGESAFINSKILHYAMAESYCQLHSLVFHSSLIIGEDNSVFAQRYIDPLIQSRPLDICLCGFDYQWKREITSCIHSAFEAMAENHVGYEFVVRENLSRVCLLLYKEFAAEISETNNTRDLDTVRIKKMLDYIHEHYSENMVLSQIASTANIGERECLRCFQRVIQITPIQYLLKYRINQGASMLLGDKTRSISDISTQCGFDSSSNFSQVFKRFFKCTPREYRKAVL